MDVNKRYIIYNSQLEKAHYLLTGKHPKPGHEPYEDYSPEIKLERDKILENVLKGNRESLEADYFINGKHSYYKVSYNPVITNSSITGISHIAVDITQIKETEQKYRSLVEQSLVGVYIIQARKLVYCNPKCCEFLGYSEQELLNKPLSSIIYKEDMKTVLDNIDYGIKDSAAKRNYQFRALKKDGSLVWLEVFGSSVNYNGMNAVIGTLIDVTERKRVLNDLVQRNTDLEQFAFIVSHNLRAPLARIMGLNNLLSIDIPENEKKIVLKGIESSSRELDEVVMDMTAVLKIRRDNTEPKEHINLTELIEHIKYSFRTIINHHQARIEVNFRKVNEIYSIRSTVTNIFSQLISNALKFSKPDQLPVLHITSELCDSKILVKFKDNGLGLDLSKHGKQMFGLYKHFHPHIEGKGVGLFMVKTQVEALDGNIEVTSIPSVGSEFTISLPK
ncbi:MAG TPA: PAS domain-containing sensor histidine kinase [Bacteroidia bacterium]|nr:PAS domain-containing sensor histidine kinase [Bacteroidia bacterium]